MEEKYWWWIGGGALAVVGIGTGVYLITRRPSSTVPASFQSASTRSTPTASSTFANTANSTLTHTTGQSVTPTATSRTTTSRTATLTQFSLQATPAYPVIGQSVAITASAVFNGAVPAQTTIQLRTQNGAVLPILHTTTATNGFAVATVLSASTALSQTVQAALIVQNKTVQVQSLTVTWQNSVALQTKIFNTNPQTNVYYHNALNGQITPSPSVPSTAQTRYAESYAQLGILPNNSSLANPAAEQEAIALGIEKLKAAGASATDIENYLVQNYGFAPSIAANEAAQNYPLTYYA